MKLKYFIKDSDNFQPADGYTKPKLTKIALKTSGHVLAEMNALATSMIRIRMCDYPKNKRKWKRIMKRRKKRNQKVRKMTKNRCCKTRYFPKVIQTVHLPFQINYFGTISYANDVKLIASTAAEPCSCMQSSMESISDVATPSHWTNLTSVLK